MEEGLVEMNMGDLEGLSGAEFAVSYPDLVRAWREEPHAVSIPGGETLADVQARGLAAVLAIAATVGPGDRVVAVTHQLVLASVVCALSGEPLSRFRSYMHRNTGITTLGIPDRPGAALEVVDFDDAAHLSG